MYCIIDESLDNGVGRREVEKKRKSKRKRVGKGKREKKRGKSERLAEG